MSATELASLYDQQAPALYRFLMALTHHEADTRDLLQEAFLRAARRPAKEVLRDPAAWLFRTARNLFTDHTRRTGARHRAMEKFAAEPADDAAEDELDAAALKAAAGAFAGLPAEQRAVVHLKIWEGCTFARIAEMLDLPANTAASRYRYALQNLRSQLPHPATAHAD
jgi:RNA polymerase sigma-70 factor (ECF subfamily)